jgi:cytochrome c oxidase subunit II
VNHLMVVYNLIYVVLVVAGLGFFAMIFLSTRPSARAKPISVAAWKRRENGWMYVVMLALLAALAATIFETPWRASADANRQVVQVTGEQFGFVFSTATVHAGRQVEFHLRSADVNHAFAVYDPAGTFVAQAQMMPDHPQVLRVTFTKPGRYTVRCFEYCGVGHHLMQASFRVVP